MYLVHVWQCLTGNIDPELARLHAEGMVVVRFVYHACVAHRRTKVEWENSWQLVLGGGQYSMACACSLSPMMEECIKFGLM